MGHIPNHIITHKYLSTREAFGPLSLLLDSMVRSIYLKSMECDRIYQLNIYNIMAGNSAVICEAVSSRILTVQGICYVWTGTCIPNFINY
jgi:hypothetical protein